MVNKANLKLYFLKQPFLDQITSFWQDNSCLAMLNDTFELIYYGLRICWNDQVVVTFFIQFLYRQYDELQPAWYFIKLS